MAGACLPEIRDCTLCSFQRRVEGRKVGQVLGPFSVR